VSSMAPTYRLLWGIPGRSNALAIAERLGLQDDVIVDARDLVSEENDASVEDVVSVLQAQRGEQRRLNDELQAELGMARKGNSELALKQALLENELSTMRKTVEEEIATELAEARSTIASLVKRAQQSASHGGGGSELRDVQQASQEIARLAQKQAGKGGGRGSSGAEGAGSSESTGAGRSGGHQLTGGGAVGVDSIAPGDQVLVPRLGEALVEVEARKGGQLTVVYGGLKMKVKVKEVARVERPAPPPPPPSKKSKRGGGGGGAKPVVRFTSNTLDLRGERPAEIEAELGRALDRALSSGSLWVIHGHGTGSLKKRVRELLNDDPLVVRIEDAPQTEGGTGCTIAVLGR